MAAAILATAAIQSAAFSPESDQHETLRVAFDNGDEAEIICNAQRERCRIRVRIYGRTHDFTAATTAAIGDIIPDRFELVRVQERPEEFGMGLRVWCSEETMRTAADTECYANVTVRDGKIASVSPYQVRPQFVNKSGR